MGTWLRSIVALLLVSPSLTCVHYYTEVIVNVRFTTTLKEEVEAVTEKMGEDARGGSVVRGFIRGGQERALGAMNFRPTLKPLREGKVTEVSGGGARDSGSGGQGSGSNVSKSDPTSQCFCGIYDCGGDTTTNPTSHRPWMATITKKGKSSSSSSFCMATLLNQRFLITSRHCVEKRLGIKDTDGSATVARFHKSGTLAGEDSPLASFHPVGGAESDLLLAKTREAVHLAIREVMPICLPPQQDSDHHFDDLTCREKKEKKSKDKGDDDDVKGQKLIGSDDETELRCYPSIYKRARVTYVKSVDWMAKRKCYTNQRGPRKFVQCEEGEKCHRREDPPQSNECKEFLSKYSGYVSTDEDVVVLLKKNDSAQDGGRSICYPGYSAGEGNAAIQCAGFHHAKKFGWCKVDEKGKEEEEAWGFCLPCPEKGGVAGSPYLLEWPVDVALPSRGRRGVCQTRDADREACMAAVLARPAEAIFELRPDFEGHHHQMPIQMDTLDNIGANGVGGYLGTACKEDLGAPVWKEHDWRNKGRYTTVAVLVGLVKKAGVGKRDECNKSKNDEKEKMPTISRIRYYLPELRRLIKEGDCTESANSGVYRALQVASPVVYDDDIEVQEGYVILQVRSRDPVPTKNTPKMKCQFRFPGDNEVADVDRKSSLIQKTSSGRSFHYYSFDPEHYCAIEFSATTNDSGAYGFTFGDQANGTIQLRVRKDAFNPSVVERTGDEGFL